MQYKSDWDMAKKRFEAFWNGEIIDRCCVSVKACENLDDPKLLNIPESDEDRVKYWTDPEWIIKRNRKVMEHTYYGGESFPAIWHNLGAGGHAGYFKGAKHYCGESIWFFPSLSDPDELEFDENSFLYRKTLDLAKAYVEDSCGDYMVTVPDATGNIDALSHLMGPEELMPAMIEEPESVQRALKKIEAAYERIQREAYEIVRDVNDGGSCIDWLSTWAPGFHAQLQSDMSVMLSNPMFKEFIMPELQAQSEFLDYPLYHLDGIEQIRHLDDLLSIPKLRTIQWTQVAGQPPCTDYFPELRKIQAAGKNLLIIVTPDQIEPIMENLSSKGLLLVTTAPTREDADAIINMVSRLTHE